MIDVTKYNNDVERIFLRLVPYFYKIKPESNAEREKFVAYMKVIVSCLKNVQEAVLNKAIELKALLDVTGQHLSLQEHLNDIYDPELRRILLVENDILGVVGENWYLYGESDPENKVWYLYGESDPVPKTWITQPEFSDQYNFTVQIPSAITFNTLEMEARLNKYVLATKIYNIELV